jgi:hypothetical protein
MSLLPLLQQQGCINVSCYAVNIYSTAILEDAALALSHSLLAVANGLRTDHPIPDLPIVDDSALPLDDPGAIEAIGRKHDTGTWGRWDKLKDGGWVAFTTDAQRPDLAWVVRWHPQHGRSVMVYRDGDAAGEYMTYTDEALLFRSGGYWWNGDGWFRPSKVFDKARGRYVNRPVAAAVTISAADLLDTGADPGRGLILPISDLNPDRPYAEAGRRWRDDLALWAQHHADGRHAAGCVVQLNAPELSADQLLGVAELAQVAGIAASTLRAYLARGESEVPAPQAVVGGRSMWSRPVAEDWAEARRRSSDSAAATMAHPDRSDLHVGVADLWTWFTRAFTTTLWGNPTFRKRFALRWRTQAAIEEVAHDLAWTAAGSLNRIISSDDLGITVRAAVLGEWAAWQRTYGQEPVMYPLTPAVTRMLDWLIRHDPRMAQAHMAEIIGDAEGDLGIPPATAGQALLTALALDGKLGDGAYNEFIDLTLPPDN